MKLQKTFLYLSYCSERYEKVLQSINETRKKKKKMRKGEGRRCLYILQFVGVMVPAPEEGDEGGHL